MQRKSGVYISSEVQATIRKREAFQSCFGLRRALEMAHNLAVLPNDYDACHHQLTSAYGPVFARYFHDYLDDGMYFRSKFRYADRVQFYIQFHDCQTKDQLTLSMTVDGSKYLTIGFDVRFGTICSIQDERLGLAGIISVLDLQGYVSIRRCVFCGVELDKHRGLFSHQPICPHRKESYLRERTDWQEGFDDAYNQRDERSPTSQEYRLGWGMGGLTYQADLACGLTHPH